MQSTINRLQCPQCQQPMEPGFLLDDSGKHVDRGFWAQNDIATYMRGGKQHLPITAMRCPACGRLELFACQIASQVPNDRPESSPLGDVVSR